MQSSVGSEVDSASSLEKISFERIAELKLSPKRLFSATHEEIIRGLTSDIYFIKTEYLLRKAGFADRIVSAEIFAREAGVMAGLQEVLNLIKLAGLEVEVEAIPEGEEFEAKEVVMTITGKYVDFAIYETPILGILASSSGWATAARECKRAAGDKPVLVFGARHLHPAVAPVMERAALIGGVDGASCVLGALLANRKPTGTMPHAFVLIIGDTTVASEIYDRYLPPDEPRIILVDTFKDEVEETLRVARVLRERLYAVRLDTPAERGRVTPHLVREVKEWLRVEGFPEVKVFVSGGLNPDRIRLLSEAGADGFGVGAYISNRPPIEMTMDIKVVSGKPVAKRGRLPGLRTNPKLKKVYP